MSAKRVETKAPAVDGQVEHKQFASTRVEFKEAASESSPGRMRIYFAAFGNWDDVRPMPDRVVQGAFKDYLPKLIKSGWSSWNHEWKEGKLPVGTIEDAGEDKYGAWVEVEFHSTPEAQAVYTVAKERYDRGKDVVASMSYIARKSQTSDVEDKDLRAKGITRGRDILEAEVLEAGTVIIPANPLAVATDVKSLNLAATGDTMVVQIKAMFEAELRDRTLTIWNLTDVLQCVMWRLRSMEEACELLGQPFDFEGQLRAALTEFTERVVEGQVKEDQEEDASDIEDADLSAQDATEMAMTKRRLIDGLSFKADLAAMIDVVGRIMRRTQGKAKLLSNQGRPFSSENAAPLTDLAEKMIGHGDAMKQHASELRDMVAASQKAKGQNGNDAGGGDGEGNEDDPLIEEKQKKLIADALHTVLWSGELLTPSTPIRR